MDIDDARRGRRLYLIRAAEDIDTADPVATLQGMKVLADRLDAAIHATAKEAARAGHGWPEIGVALGISRQAARARYTK